ncbi:KPN_02809 family neutral zinc metallopeptidase [Tomitella biformata]|uniref:KPN_02809 family neutral zinc metallopeptidase n=1 Tax=Tomitella biformata TaxID=630403 RepID=UPI0004678677|nr:neutral zinc metallopeptidase [Tomitella biformata]
MTFREGARINPGRVSVGGGGRGPKMAIGGGIGGLVIVVLALVLGVDPGSLGIGGVDGGSASQSTASGTLEGCETGADANNNIDCRIAFTAESLDQVWAGQLPTAGLNYVQPDVVLFNGGVDTGGCGSASSDVGPFYCPADSTAYFDSTFFNLLETQYGSSGGPLAQEYVVAHEFGHHLQNLIGDPRRNARGAGAESASVRTELQADCFAGIWAYYADKTPAPGTNEPMLNPLTDRDIADALSAAASVGDDHIQQQSSGRVNPDSWTHGSSAQRQQWFTTGYRTGQISSCDTFAAPDLG